MEINRMAPKVLTRAFKEAQVGRPPSRLKRQPQLSGGRPAEGTGCKQATGELFLDTAVL